MIVLRQSTASQSVKLGPFVDDTDGVTAETGLTIANTDIKLSKAGGTMASKNSGGGTHDANGWYTITLDATDTATVGALQVSCKVAGAAPVFMQFQVVEQAIYDALFAASATGLLPANVTQFGGTNGTFASGRPEVNTTHAAGTAWRSGAITSDVFATGAITAGAIAADAIGASELAADAVTEIQSGLATAAALSTAQSDITAILADTNELQGDWANGGRLDLLIDELTTQGDTNEAAIAALNDPSVGELADAVWEELIADHSGTSGSTAEALNAAGAAGDPWTTNLPGAYGVGSAGYIVGNTLDAAVSSAVQNTNYPDGWTFVNEFDGAAGTTPDTHARLRNPSNSFADAAAVAAALKTKQVRLQGPLTIPNGSYSGFQVDVNGHALTINNAAAFALSKFTSSVKGGSLQPDVLDFQDKVTLSTGCHYDALTIFNCQLESYAYCTGCTFAGSITATNAGNNTSYFIGCYTAKGGGTSIETPLTFDCGNGAGTEVFLFLGHYGDIQLENLEAGQVFVNYGWGRQIIADSCTGGTVYHTSHAPPLAEDLSVYAGPVTLVPVSDPGELLQRFGGMIELDGSVYRFTVNALENAPAGGGGGGLNEQQVRDAMKLAPSAGSPASGSVDEHLDTLVAGGGGGGTTTNNIIPVTRQHRVGDPVPIDVAAFIGADFTHNFLFTGDLTGETFTFAVETAPGREDVAADYAPVVAYNAGTNQTTITPTIGRANHTAEALHSYALRHVSGTNAPIARGDYAVSYAADA